MNFGEMVSFVRTHCDADDQDSPTETLTVYARVAYRDIVNRRLGWDHMQVNYPLTTVAFQDEYPLNAIGNNDLDRVTSVVDRSVIGRRLIPATRADADLVFSRPSLPSSANAAAFTIEGENLILFPTPSTDAREYTVRGFRKPAVWPTTPVSVPDLPEVLHDAIPLYMIAQYYMSQEDQALAAQYMGDYERLVNMFVAGETSKAKSARPTIMGGQQPRGRGFRERVRGALE